MYKRQNQACFFTFLSHDGKDHHVPAIFATFSDDIPSLGLTGETNMDEFLATEDQLTPRKRDRGERIVWTPEEDEYLRAAVQTYGDKTEKWAKIAACVPGRTNKNCRKRWFHSLDPSLKKGPWTEEEDHLLRTGVQKFKGQWSKIAERIQGRTDDQCAKRWREGLDPHIDRAAWTPEDDVILLQKFEEFGSQWQKIALSFPGRPGLHCRNRWRKIQRGLNHMKRVHKRRRSQPSSRQGSTETQKLEALMDINDDDYSLSKRSGKQRHSSDDYLRDGLHEDDYRGLDDSNDSGHSDQDDDKDDSGSDEEKPYGCAIPDCTFASSSPSLLFYHFKASHHGTTVLKPFRCTMPGCEDRKRYKGVNGLQYHVTHAKNTPGHSGHSGHSSSTPQDAAQTTTNKTAATSTSTSTSSGGKVRAPSADSLTPQMELQNFSFMQHPPTSLPTPPTPAEIQSLIPPLLKQQQIVSLQAFNIPHTPESLEDTVMTTAPMGGSLAQTSTQAQVQLQPQLQQLQSQLQHHLQSPHQPQLHSQLQHQHQVQLQPQLQPSLQPHLQPQSQSHIQQQSQPHVQLQPHHTTTTSLQCPELGCGQFFHAIPGLNAHMATQHGHRSITMAIATEGTDSFGVDSIAIPENDFDDMDIDLAYLASNSASPMDSNLLMLEDSNLQSQLDSLTRDHGALSLDPTTPDTEQDLSMLTMSEMLFASHVSNSLSNVGAFDNRIHFGSHINVSSDDPWTLPSTPVTSANVSPRLSAVNISTTPVVSGTTTTATSKPVVLKKFPCMVKDCPKSYGSNAALKVHMRNDHSGLGGIKAPKGVAPGAGAGTGAGTGTATLDYHLTINPSIAPSIGSSHSQAGLGSVPTLHVDPKSISQVKAKPTKKSDEPSNKPYKCLVPGCGKGYTNINGLKNHLLQAHGSTPSKTA
ncbi:hypothetical protein BGX29_008847 [Mortierella sp. GBA35]|nr:hypothetical protein BGX29_008847 [Mortierella sp. GBA35]